MKIVHVLSSFGRGGQEQVAVDLARCQVDAGHEVLAISLAEQIGPHAQSFDAAGAEVCHIAKRGKGLDRSLPGRLQDAFTGFVADVVHTHNPQPLVYAAPAAKLAGCRLIHTKHGANPASTAQLWLRRAAAACADYFVAVSPVTAALARDQRECAEGQLKVIQNGIALDHFRRDDDVRRRIRAELGVPLDACVVGTVGRLAPEKNQALLLRAIRPLLGPKVELLLVGDGPERESLQAQVAAWNTTTQVHFLGQRSDVPDVLCALDVFVLSSKTEGLPLCIVEAMASGLPVVSTDVGGIAGVLRDGRYGALVPSDDAAALRLAIQELVDDPSRARAIGIEGQIEARRLYSVEHMTERYLDLYTAPSALKRWKRGAEQWLAEMTAA